MRDFNKAADTLFMITQQILIDHCDDEVAGKSGLDRVILHAQRVEALHRLTSDMLDELAD